MLWKFLSYVDGRGRSEFDKWYEAASGKCRATFDVRISQLGNMEFPEWEPKFCKQLRSDSQIYEVRFKADNVQHRPLGFMWPERRCFTFILFATEHNDRFVPSDAVNSALRRIGEIRNGTREAKEIDVV
jgi:hypothetical protein